MEDDLDYYLAMEEDAQQEYPDFNEFDQYEEGGEIEAQQPTQATPANTVIEVKPSVNAPVVTSSNQRSTLPAPVMAPQPAK